MRYSNKDKGIREENWTKVSIPSKSLLDTNQDLKQWCEQQESDGRFYYYYGAQSWWFEFKEDATLFMLRWAR